MARDHNVLEFTGRLGNDPELRYTPSGASVCNFNVAVGNDYTNSDGEKVSKTMWVKCVSWNKGAEVHNQYLHKGSRVFVSGQLVTNESGNPKTFEGKNGTSASFELTVRELVFLDSANASASGSDAVSKMDTAPVVANEEDLPF